MSALLDILGTVGTVLDTPASLVRGLLAGDPGRAFGGLFDPNQRLSGRDMLEKWGVLGANEEGIDAGDVGGFAAEMLTDPLNLVGAGLLKHGYRKAMGPMHPGGTEKITELLRGVPSDMSHIPKNLQAEVRAPLEDFLARLDALDPKMQRRALGEIPPGSKWLSAGGEAGVLDTGEDVLRLAPEGFPAPPKDPMIRQPTRHIVYGEPGNQISMTRSPYAEIPDYKRIGREGKNTYKEVEEQARRMREELIERGLDPFDVYSNNIGKMGENWVVIDPQAVGFGPPLKGGETVQELMELTRQQRAKKPPIPTTPMPWDNMSPIAKMMGAYNVARVPRITNEPSA
jgi:hypothetical protein